LGTYWRSAGVAGPTARAPVAVSRPGPMIFGARGETLSKGPFVIIIIIIRCTYI
jgi:hypothetical protein